MRARGSPSSKTGGKHLEQLSRHSLARILSLWRCKQGHGSAGEALWRTYSSWPMASYPTLRTCGRRYARYRPIDLAKVCNVHFCDMHRLAQLVRNSIKRTTKGLLLHQLRSGSAFEILSAYSYSASSTLNRLEISVAGSWPVRRTKSR